MANDLPAKSRDHEPTPVRLTRLLGYLSFQAVFPNSQDGGFETALSGTQAADCQAFHI